MAAMKKRVGILISGQDVRYYNDSKATTPHATITALESMGQRVVLICGGCDQVDSLEKLCEAICRRARAVICSGENRAKIAAQIRRLGSHLPAPTIKSVHEFNGGVNLARRMARPGEVVLFSPGAASYDEFDNFEQRGDRFKAIVKQWI